MMRPARRRSSAACNRKVALRSEVLTQREPLTSVLEAYEAFDTRQPGWIKVKLEPVPVTA